MPVILGRELCVSDKASEDAVSYLFLTLFLTQLLVFLGGGAIAHSLFVFEHAAWIALTCVQITACLYMLTRMSGSFCWGLISVYGLLALLAYSRLPMRGELGFVAGCAGLFYAVRFLRVSRDSAAAAVLAAAVASVTCLMVAGAYTSFDMSSRLFAGDLNQDTLFHSSIAAMIKNYGVISTGLQGVVDTPYHALSHALMAGISLISHQPVFDVYGVAGYVLFAPVLIMTTTVACVTLDSKRELPVWLCWGLVAITLCLIPRGLSRWAVWDSYFVSESYMVSLGLFMTSLPALYKRELTRFDPIFVLLATFLIAHAKATVGIIYAGLWFVRVLFLREHKLPRGLEMACLFLAIASAISVVWLSAQAHSSDVTVSPLDFLSTYGGGAAVAQGVQMLNGEMEIHFKVLLTALKQALQFFAAHFLLSWIVIGVAIWRFGWRELWRAPMGIYVLAATAVGGVGVLLLGIPAGALFYISNVAMFVALPGAVGVMASVISRWKKATPRVALGLGLVVTCACSVNTLRGELARLSIDRLAQDGKWAQALMALRETSLEQVYRYMDDTIPTISRLPCTAYPFIFPALSEHAWSEVIKPQEKCPLIYYGYEQYGLSAQNQKVTMPPKLLEGMRIVDFKIQ